MESPEGGALSDVTGGRPPSDARFAGRVLLGGLGLFITVGLATQLLNVAYGLWVSEVAIFLAVPYLALNARGVEPFRDAGVATFPWSGVLLGGLLGVANMAALVAPLQFFSQSLAPEGLKEAFDSSQIFRNLQRGELYAMLLGVSLAAPFCEEFFFRGVVQKHFGPTLRSLFWTSVIFSAFHLDPVGFLSRVELGLLFGLLFLRTGSLWPGIAAHFANNTLAAVILVATLDEPKKEAALSEVATLAGVGGLGLLSLLLLIRRYPHLLPMRAPPRGPAREKVPLARAALPFAAFAVLSLAPLALFDARGVRINLKEPFSPLPRPAKDDSAFWKAAHEELNVLRKRARSGEIPVSDYLDRRKVLSDRYRKERLEAFQMKR